MNYLIRTSETADKEMSNAMYVGEVTPVTTNIPQNIENAKRIYRKNFLSNMELLNDYAKAYFGEENRKENEVKNTITPPRNARQVNARQAAIENIKICRPTKVIGSLFYSTQNDSSIECSYVFNLFASNCAYPNSKNLIFNACPNFIKNWVERYSGTCKTFFAVRNYIMVRLYSKEFYKKAIFNDDNYILNQPPTFDSALIICRGLETSEIYNYIKTAAILSKRIILFGPEILLKEEFYDLVKQCNHNLLSLLKLPKEAANSNPRKKAIYYLEQSAGNAITNVDCYSALIENNSLFIENECRKIPITNLLQKGISLKKAFENYDAAKSETDPIKRRNAPQEYHFSNEIMLYYTCRKANGRYAAKAYYRIPKDNMRNKYGKRSSPIIEKGLRAGSKEGLFGKLEQKVYSPEFSEPILEYLNAINPDDLKGFSLKTVWFLFRLKLKTYTGYNDELAKHMLGERNLLTDMCISDFNEEIANEVISEIALKNKDFKVRKYWVLLNYIYKEAAYKKIITQNPIESILEYYSNRMTAYEEEIRRNLVHSVLDINEEKRVLEQLCAETNEIYGDRHAYLYETNSIAIMVLFRMFTGLSNRECCALRWKDIQEHPSYGFKNIFVTKYMADAQTIKNYVSEEKRNKIRYVPIVKPIADMLEARESYIHKKYNIPYEQIQEMPIFLNDAALKKSSENKNIFLEPKKTRNQSENISSS